MFHETFGVYAQGVGYETITAPKLITAEVVRSRTPTIDPRIDAADLGARVERLLGEHDSK